MWFEVKWKLDEIEKWRNERRVKKECEAAAHSQNQICMILMREARERNYTVFSQTQHNSAWHHTHSIYLYLVFFFHLTFDTQPTAITNSTTKANGTTMFKARELAGTWCFCISFSIDDWQPPQSNGSKNQIVCVLFASFFKFHVQCIYRQSKQERHTSALCLANRIL